MHVPACLLECRERLGSLAGARVTPQLQPGDQTLNSDQICFWIVLFISVSLTPHDCGSELHLLKRLHCLSTGVGTP